MCPIPPKQPFLLQMGTKEKYKLGDTLRFSCTPGHRLFGHSLLICQSPGFWSAPIPTCDEVQCTRPPSLLNGSPILPPSSSNHSIVIFRGGDIITYKCNYGYILRNPLSRTCLDSGAWSGDIPGTHCDLITCEPRNIPHAAVTPIKSKYVLNDVVIYECELGYLLHGSISLKCVANNKWNVSDPECELIFCPPPEPPSNGYVVTPDRRVLNTVAVYSCEVGYEIDGVSERICSMDGEYSDVAPTCHLIKCPPLDETPHLHWKSSSLLYNSTASVVCDDGYVVNGSNYVTCSDHGSWLGLPVHCQPVTCNVPAVPLHGHVVFGSRMEYRDKIEYICDGGYMLSGPIVRYCQANGTWSGTNPTCEQVLCPNPEQLEHGYYVSESRRYMPGSLVRFVCERGYYIENKPTRTCRVDGTWSGPMPKCQLIKCSTLQPITNGRLNVKDNRLGSLAEYQCDEGYELSGPSIRTCSEDFSWRGDEPTCGRIQCPLPDPPSNGDRIYDELPVLGSIVSFVCLEGYKLKGDNVSSCLPNKTWSSLVPVCEPILCDVSSIVFAHGHVISNNYSVNATMQYVCSDGYEKLNNVSMTCLSNGSWDNLTPYCERVMCPKPKPFLNGFINGSNYHFKEELLYSCKFGFEMIGSYQRTCQANRVWSGVEPRCVQIVCPLEMSTSFLQVQMNRSFVGDRVLYHCIPKYELVGNSVRACQLNKTWSGAKPYCQQIECAPLRNISFGIIHINTTFVDNSVIYLCQQNYELIGDNIRTCLANKSWSGIEPYCKQIECVMPSNISHGEVFTNKLYVGSEAIYHCHLPYELIGNKTRTCLPNKTWSNTEPKCVRITCPPLENIQRGIVKAAQPSFVADVAVYSCNLGYELIGVSERICSPNKTWSKTEPRCLPIECLPPLNFSNGHVKAKYPSYIGDTAIYKCNFNHELIGDDIRTCLVNKTWSKTEPQCVLITCPLPSNISQGNVTVKNPSFVGDEALYSCYVNHELVGSNVRTCLVNKTWSKAVPRCVPITCPLPSNISQGNLTVKNPSYVGDKALYSCYVNHELVGSNVRTCLVNKTWSKTEPRCVPITCPLPSNISQGNVTVKNPSFVGDEALYSCYVNHELVGNNIRTCLVNKTWSKTEPQCVPITCPLPSNISQGNVTVKNPSYVGDEALYNCYVNHELVGSNVRTCLVNKTWSKTEPQCVPITCPLPSNISQGNLTVKNPSYVGDKALYSCYVNHELVGSNVRTCLVNKTWSKAVPRCVPITCPLPSNINQGNISVKNPSYVGDKALYSCYVNHELVGSNVRTCLVNKTWSKTEPRCVPITCPLPSNISQGNVTVKNPSFVGDEALYSCYVNHELVGSNVRTCLVNKTWSKTEPQCVPITCPLPSNISQGNVTVKNPSFVGDEALYNCHVNHELVGSNVRICLVSKTWSKTEPQCVSITCPLPSNISQGNVIVKNPSFVGDEALYNCYVNHELVGSNVRTCLVSKTWSKTEPQCVPITCPLPSNINQGNISVKNPSYVGDEALYSCFLNHELVGSNVRTCLVNKTWSKTEPQCVPITCPLPSNINQGYISVKNPSYVGDKALYSCYLNHELVGSNVRTCLVNKTWSKTEPQCVPITCPLPSNISQGNISVKNPSYVGDEALYNCYLNHELVGSNVRTCLVNKTWSKTEPQCVPITCPLPSNISQGNVTVKNPSFVGDEALYSCYLNHELVGSNLRTCLVNKTWSKTEPRCVPITCPLPSNISQGYISVKNPSYVGDEALYNCYVNHELVGSNVRTCLVNKTWSKTEPQCVPITCPLPSNINQGNVIVKNPSFVGDEALYSCYLNHELVGSNVRTCLVNKTWSKTEPQCVLITCPLPSNISQGNISVKNPSYVGDEALYSCFLNHELVGSNVRTCLVNKTWSKTEPQCVPITCPLPSNISQGNISVKNPSYVGDKALYNCYLNHELVGSNVRTCLVNKTWSKTEPQCVPITCPLPSNISQGYISVKNPSYVGDEALYSCYVNHELVGSNIRTCLVNKTWSKEKPKCVPISCLPVANISNGDVDVKYPSFVGDKAVYKCKRQYELMGSSIRECLHNKTWNGSQPHCVPAKCPALKNISRGYVNGSNVLVGDSVIYSCDLNYELIGNPVRTCLYNRSWSGAEPQCKAITCHFDAILMNGQVVLAEWPIVVGSSISYVCKAGFELVGPAVRYCLSNTSWDGIEPQCVQMYCSSPGNITNGYVTAKGSVGIGDKIRYICREGFELVGHSDRVCQANKTWNGTEPFCEAVMCLSPGNISNGYVSASGLIGFAKSITYFCHEDFELIGISERECLLNRTWSGEVPFCRLITCAVVSIANGYLSNNNTVDISVNPANDHFNNSDTVNVGNNLAIRCQAGYRLEGSPVLKCLPGGVWNGTYPSCLKIYCDVPSNISYGNFTPFQETYVLNESITYSCDSGYELIGSTLRVCKAHQTWSGNDKTACVPIKCDMPNEIDNGQRIVLTRFFGNTVTYICDEDYELVGQSVRKCQSNKTWSGFEPSCEKIACPVLRNITNGFVLASSWYVKETATYSCNLGYDIKGNVTRVCLNDKSWTGSEPTCELVVCSVPDNITNGYYIATSLSLGMNVTYVCDLDYELIGDAMRTCQNNKSWSGYKPECIPISCPLRVNISDRLVNISNGLINISNGLINISYGLINISKGPINISNGMANIFSLLIRTTIVYSCYDGYKLIGPRERSCLSNKTWSGIEPRCEMITCAQPSGVYHGLVRVTSLSVGNSAFYECDNGFELVGKALIICSANGTWDNKPPSCWPIKCSLIQNITNGFVNFTSLYVGSNATFSCNFGYKLMGHGTLTCFHSGKWSGDLPQCIPILCDSLKNITNGRAIIESVLVGSNASYECNYGYELVGAEVRFCGINGEWSGAESSCVRINCSLPGNITNGAIVVGGLSVGEQILYSCNDGYRLAGSMWRQCQQNKTWSGSNPSCEKITCPTFDNISNGQVTMNTSLLYDRLLYSCVQNYELLGDAERVCLNNGSWSGVQPYCRLIECPPLSNLTNGIVIGDKLTVGSAVNYECLKGYRIAGMPSRICQANKTWSAEEPSCVAITCAYPKNISNGLVNSTYGLNIGDSITYSCQEGFQLSGAYVRVCNENGSWNGTEPVCKRVMCKEPHSPANGSVLIEGVYVEQTVTYTCDEGFKLKGDAKRICLVNSSWSGIAPFCERIMCHLPVNISNGWVSVFANFFGSEIIYYCYKGYELQGHSHRICQTNETWSAAAPSCHRIYCAKPPVVANAVALSDVIASGDVVEYRCQTGYEMTDKGNITCSDNRTYIGKLPRCDSVKCVLPRAPANGSLFVRGLHYGKQVIFLCDEGFELVGFQVVTCGEAGVWSNKEPTCQAIVCPNPRQPTNGIIKTTNGLQFGQKAEYSCLPGYLLQGIAVRQCTARRIWSGEEPICQEVRCPSPIIKFGYLSNGTGSGQVRSSDRFLMGMSVIISCDEGHHLVGTEKVTCMSNATWYPPLPSCEKVKCPHLNISFSPLNGVVFAFSKHVTVTCDLGYAISGPKELICQANGTWSASMPSCEIITCPDIVFTQGRSQVTKSPHSDVINAYGTVIKYFCRKGFTTAESNEIECTARGVWSSLPPTCVPVTCDLPIIDNANKLLMLVNVSNVFEYGDIVKFQCMPGYELHGSAWLVCGENGLWQGNLPRCYSAECSQPYIPENVNMYTAERNRIEKFPVGITVMFECKRYHLLIGNSSMICLEGKLWSSKVPICVHLSCYELQIENGYVGNNNTLAGSVVNVICNMGYELDGPSELLCNINGTWSLPIPKCVAMFCPKPVVANGFISLGLPSLSEGYTFGDIVMFECDVGHRLIGEAESMCMPDKTWSSPLPLCEAITCSLPPLPEHGYWDGENRVDVRPGTRIQLQCNKGYKIEGSKEIVCNMNGNWQQLDNFPFCQQVFCPSLHLENGYITKISAIIPQSHNFSVDDLAVFHCFEGYFLEGSETSTCEANGQWNAAEPLCLPITCPNPSPVEHGIVHVTLLQYNNTYHVTCDRGYELDGPPQVVCEASGQWSHVLGCRRVKCPIPLELPNGQFSLSGRLYSDLLTYSCKLGYTLVGQVNHRCLANGTWSGSIPSCVTVKCPSSLPIANSRNLTRLYSYTEMANVVCIHGHELVGVQRTTECLASGQWKVIQVECRIIECPKPPSIDRGRLVGKQYSVNSTISYVCEEGYELAGQVVRRCLESKRWSGSTPSCVRVTCPTPENILNGLVDLTDNTFGSHVTYSCNTGFQLVGESVRKCQANRQWSGDEPHCKVIICLTPSTLANGKVITESKELVFNYGSVVQYTCNVGHDLIGDTFRVCLESGEWSSASPQCQKIMCPSPKQIDFGLFEGTDFAYGSTVMYKCLPRYQLMGNAERTCQADKTWSGSTPYCRIKRCPSLPRLDYGQVIGTDVTAGATVTFRCHEGRRLVGSSQLTCEGTTWSGNMPRCEKAACNAPPTLPNTIPDTNTYGFGDTVVYKCQKGFTASGNPTSRCLSGNRWSDSSLRCVPVSCRAPPIVAHGHTNGSTFVFRDVVYYACLEGYRIKGPNKITCNDSGQWIGDVPKCDIVQCGTAPIISFATTTITKGNVYGSRAIYNCNNGYILQGPKELICTVNGTWNPGGSTKCVPIDCGPPPQGFKLSVNFTDTKFGSVANYYCEQNFRLQGSNMLNCIATGQWRGDVPVCIRERCNPPPTVSQGAYSTLNFSVGSSVTYLCDKGHILKGPASRTCDPDGFWTGSQPTCDRKFVFIVFISM